MYYQRKNVTVIKDPPLQYMNTIKKLKRYEKIVKAAPALATLAVLALGQAAYAATSSPDTTGLCIIIWRIIICIF